MGQFEGRGAARVCAPALSSCLAMFDFDALDVLDSPKWETRLGRSFAVMPDGVGIRDSDEGDLRSAQNLRRQFE